MAELVIALDMSDSGKACEIASELKDTIKWLKIGLELYIACGPRIVENLKNLGFKIFLDLKMFDIPHTVEKAVASALALNVDMLTLHCMGGKRMCLAAKECVKQKGSDCVLLGVTVLTSFADGELPLVEIPVQKAALDLAKYGTAWGLDGVVCSGWEVEAIKTSNPQLLCLCPGIRLKSGEDDQRRVYTPAQAVAAGADFLVAGRPVYDAPMPAVAARLFLENMNQSGKI